MSAIVAENGSVFPTPQVVPIEGLSHQVDLWTEDTQDIAVALVGPLGCGKTLGLAVKAALLSWANAPIDGLLVVPTYPIARMVHIQEWPPMLESMGIKVGFKKDDSCFVWPWGSRTWLRTAERPARLAGPNLAYALFDEPGQIDREAYDRGSTRVRHPRARRRQKVLAGTPEGLNWFADLFADPVFPNRTIRATGWHPSMAHYPAQLVDQYGYDESLLRAYGRGQFVPLRVGRAWRAFDPLSHCGKVEYSASLPLVLACDFNIDTMRWEVGQFGTTSIQWLDEIALGQGGSTEEGAQEFIRRWSAKHRGEIIVTGDAAGKARSTSGKTDYRILLEELRPAFGRVRVMVPNANPRVKDRVDNTNYHLAGRGKQVRIGPACKELRKDWERCAWKRGQAELDDRDSNRGHAAAASDYAFWALARGIKRGRPISSVTSSQFSVTSDESLGAEF